MGVLVDLREVELRRVPAADAVVRAEVPGDGVAVGLGLVPLGEEEHVLAVLVSEPSDRLLCVECFIVSDITLHLLFPQLLILSYLPC